VICLGRASSLSSSPRSQARRLGTLRICYGFFPASLLNHRLGGAVGLRISNDSSRSLSLNSGDDRGTPPSFMLKRVSLSDRKILVLTGSLLFGPTSLPAFD